MAEEPKHTPSWHSPKYYHRNPQARPSPADKQSVPKTMQGGQQRTPIKTVRDAWLFICRLMRPVKPGLAWTAQNTGEIADEVLHSAAFQIVLALLLFLLTFILKLVSMTVAVIVALMWWVSVFGIARSQRFKIQRPARRIALTIGISVLLAVAFALFARWGMRTLRTQGSVTSGIQPAAPAVPPASQPSAVMQLPTPAQPVPPPPLSSKEKHRITDPFVKQCAKELSHKGMARQLECVNDKLKNHGYQFSATLKLPSAPPTPLLTFKDSHDIEFNGSYIGGGVDLKDSHHFKFNDTRIERPKKP
jgi:hypothetical protein